MKKIIKAYREPADKNYSKQNKDELFYFDPNTLVAAGLEKIGSKG